MVSMLASGLVDEIICTAAARMFFACQFLSACSDGLPTGRLKEDSRYVQRKYLYYSLCNLKQRHRLAI